MPKLYAVGKRGDACCPERVQDGEDEDRGRDRVEGLDLDAQGQLGGQGLIGR
jgi:hypothetical protein